MICKKCHDVAGDLTWVQDDENDFHGFVCGDCLDDLLRGEEPNTTYHDFRTIKRYAL